MKALQLYIPNNLFIRRIIDRIKEYKLHRYYKRNNALKNISKKQIIYMADGKMHHGGLSDRLCGIISAYNYSKQNGYDFRIYFNSPYSLEDILNPSLHNWLIYDNDISYNSKEAKPIYISNIPYYDDAKQYFDSKISSCRVNQIHIYTNARYFHLSEFKSLFHELFIPNNRLNSILKKHKEHLSDSYISLTYRFQQLLGDFKEDGFPTLNEDEKESLVERCLMCLNSLYEEFNTTILVTSDSISFLNRASQFDFVYVIPGDIRHMDYNHDDVDIIVDMKSFVDLYLISQADRIFSCCIKPLYGGSFPITASFLGNKECILIYEDSRIIAHLSDLSK